MSYTIVFETKICKLDNGDIIHFYRKGCNNDTEGRNRYEFSADYYTSDQWEKYIQEYETIESYGDSFDLKIGSRHCQWADYAKHLRTMTKRAMSIDDLKNRRSLSGRVYDGIAFYPEGGEMREISAYNDKEIDNIIYGIMYGKTKGKYRSLSHMVNSRNEIIEAVKNRNNYSTFFIGRDTSKKTRRY